MLRSEDSRDAETGMEVKRTSGLPTLKERSLIIVLGSPNDDEGNLSSIALERCGQALIEFGRSPSSLILPTGGWGDHFNRTAEAHWSYVRRHLISLGVPSGSILEGIPSRNTLEDASRSQRIVEGTGIARLVIVTSDFHERRARIIFERAFPGHRVAMAPCRTRLPRETLENLREHERRAISKLRTPPPPNS
ncbi:MAG: YdcF family protein [Acidobacteriota bacterium]|nr:MAG: YdcF family protein [Acidobacteriota bacterium]